MIRTARLWSVALVAGLLLATAGLLPAAAHAREEGWPRSVFRLTVTESENPDPSTARSVVLTCLPAGGTHPDPDTACRQLEEVDGYFELLNVDPGACILIYQPVTATADGYWEGRTVTYQEIFPNECVMLRQTGAVFDY